MSESRGITIIYLIALLGNFIADKSEFLNIVQNEWHVQVEGCNMFKLVKKLKAMKYHMKQLSWSFGNLQEKSC